MGKKKKLKIMKPNDAYFLCSQLGVYEICDGEADEEEGSKNEKSERFFAGKGTALVLALKDIPQYAERRLSTDSTRSTNSTQSNNSDIQLHLQSMFYLLQHQETLKMAVKLESQRPNRTRYLVIASRCCYRSSTAERRVKVARNNSARAPSTSGTAAILTLRQMSVDSCDKTQTTMLQEQQQQQQQQQSQSIANATTTTTTTTTESNIADSTASVNHQSPKCDADKSSAAGDNNCTSGIEESCLLGIDCNERATIGLVVPILADTTIHLDGDGGFSVSVYGKTHIFKPVSVQAMWSALQTLHKVSQKARENNFYPGGPSHDWLSHYESRIESDQSCLNEWNAMDSIESRRPPSPDAIRNKPTAKEETESVIKMKLKEIMMSVDLDEVTSKYIRGRLEEHLDMDLGEYKSFIDEEMLMILGQMDAPTEIFEHVYLGSEWNASNLEELQKNGVRHILNVTREIDNFFPGIFDYCNVRVYDDEKTNLLKHWDNTFRYITRAKAEGSKVLVHCKMGVSRSASVVIAYAMKAYNWEFPQAMQHVKERRNCIKPNKNFLNQLETYRGMLDAMKNKEKLQRSKSETNLKSTKDARLLPGSEPTPLIQALNQSNLKSAGHGVSSKNVVVMGAEDIEVTDDMVTLSRNSRTSVDVKQRRVLRRSSSTSPRSIQNHTAIVIKQLSQSLENLTPERSIAVEPKNVRFPGSNGENYSVTQNQVLHIQKNTPPTSVRTIVDVLEAGHQEIRKTVEDRKTLNLQFGRMDNLQVNVLPNCEEPATRITAASNLGSPVWTSSSKLITQTSNLSSQREDVQEPKLRSSLRLRRNTTNSNRIDKTHDGEQTLPAHLNNVNVKEEQEEKRHRRKTQSWAATSGGIIIDTPTTALTSSANAKLGSNSSIDSTSSSTVASKYSDIGFVRIQTPRQRELPSRHASWGSGDNRCGAPVRNSSWNAYDTNRNTFQYGNNVANSTTSAILEGQIHELHMSNKTATQTHTAPTHNHGTVKRTKQKLEEVTALKKLCQENADQNQLPGGVASTTTNYSKRNCNLYRSASAAGSMRLRYPHRCNSEEFVPTAGRCGVFLLQRRSDGSRPLRTDLFSASAPDAYSISDIENKNTLLQESADEAAATVLLRAQATDGGATFLLSEDQRISGNVQILKKNFEAKAGATIVQTGNNPIQSNATTTTTQTISTKKSHQSLPSSPVAQHIDHHCAKSVDEVTTTTDTNTKIVTDAHCVEQPKKNNPPTKEIIVVPCSVSSSSSCSSTSGSTTEPHDRNVKGLVHKYQATTTTTNTTSTTKSHATPATSTSATAASTTYSNFKARPRSYYDSHTQKCITGKPHDYSDGRPPPAPLKTCERILVQQKQQMQQPQTQQRRLQQHGKTHPLARLSLPKQSFNAAAYNTM